MVSLVEIMGFCVNGQTREFAKNNLHTSLQVFLYPSSDLPCVARGAAKNPICLKQNLLRPLRRLFISSSLNHSFQVKVRLGFGLS